MPYQATLKITPSFADATKELQKLTISVQRMNIQANQIQQQLQKSNIIQFPLKIQQNQLPSNLRRMHRFVQKFDRMLQSVVDRMIHELGSISRTMMRGFEITSLVSPITGALGFLTFSVAPLVLATTTGVFRWLWNKVTDLGEAMMKDRLLAMQAGTTVGAIRAFRVSFPMINDPNLIPTLGLTRLDTTSRMYSVIHWFLKVRKTNDTMSVIVDTLVAARDFMRAQPDWRAMSSAQNFGLTRGIDPRVLMILREMTDEEMNKTVKRFQELRPQFSQKTQAQNMLVDFILSVRSMWLRIQNTLGEELAKVGLVDSLKRLSEAAADFFKFALNLPVTQRMLKGLEEDLKWFGDWLADDKNQKRIGKIVSNMILNFEKGVAILVEATGNLEEANRMRREIRRHQARVGRQERGQPARPRHVAGFPLAAGKVSDLPSRTGTRTEPMAPVAPRTRQPSRPSSPGTRTQPPSTPSTRAPTPPATTAPPSTAPTPPSAPVTPVVPPTVVPPTVRGPVTPPIPPINRPPVRPSPPRVRSPLTPDDDVIPIPRQQRPWTRHPPSAASQPSNRPLPSRTPPILDDDQIQRQFRTGRRVPIDPSRYYRPPGGDIAVRPPVPTAGIPGLRGGPSGPAANRPPFRVPEAQPYFPTRRPPSQFPAPPQPPFAPPRQMVEPGPAFPRGDVTRGPLPPAVNIDPRTRQPVFSGAPVEPVTREGLPTIGDVAVRGDPRTAGVPGAPGGPSGAARYGPPPARQFPSIVDNDIIQRQFRTGQRIPIDPSRYYRPPTPEQPNPNIAVRPSVPTAGYPGAPGTPSGPRPERPPAPVAPTAPGRTTYPSLFRPGTNLPVPGTTLPPEQAKPIPGVVPGATVVPPGMKGVSSISAADQNWNRYLNRLAFLESDYKTGLTKGINKGAFQQSQDIVDRMKNTYKIKDAHLLLSGTYEQQKQKAKELIKAQYPNAAAAIERGDKSAADEAIAPLWGSVPSTHQRAVNKQDESKYKQADKVWEGKGPKAPDEQPGSSSYPSGKVPGAQAPELPQTGLSGTSRGQFEGGAPRGLVVHYTGGVIKSAEDYSRAISGGDSYMSKYNAQLFMDQEGKITRVTPYGTKTWHAGSANDWAEGIEISTTYGGTNRNLTGSGLNDKQLAALKEYYIAARKAGMYPAGAWGHSEVNPPPHRFNEGEYESQLLRELDQQRPVKITNVPIQLARDPDLTGMLDPNITRVPSPPSTSTDPRGWGNPWITKSDIQTDPVTGIQTTRSIGTITDVRPAGPLPVTITGGKVGPGGKIIGGAEIPTPKNVPAWLSQPNLTRDFSKDSTGKIINSDVLKQAENLAASGDKAGVKKFIQDQGFVVHDNYCADYVASVIKARGGDPKTLVTGQTTTPIDGGPYDTASNYLNVGEHVDPKDVQPGDVAVSKTYTYGPNKGKPISAGATGGHVGFVGSGGYDPKTGKFQFFGANPVERTNKNAGGYEFRRITYPKPPEPEVKRWSNVEPIQGFAYDQNANPLDNLKLINNSDYRAHWDKKPGSNVRDLSNIPDPTKHDTQLKDPDKPGRDTPERDPDKPRQVRDPDKPKEEKDPDKKPPVEDMSDPTGGGQIESPA
jgi:hypothetical protein